MFLFKRSYYRRDAIIFVKTHTPKVNSYRLVVRQGGKVVLDSSAEVQKVTVENQPQESAQTEAPVATAEVKKDLNYYRNIVSPHLSKSCFEINPKRLLIAAAYGAINFTLIWLAVFQVESFLLKVLFGLVIGHFNAGLAFVTHEVLHGSVVRGKKLQDFISFFTFSTFQMSPTLWRFWHNKLHHSHTQDNIRDPDAYPNVLIYKQSKLMQRIFRLTPGSGYIRSYFYFLYWFTFQTHLNQLYMRFRNGLWKQLDQRKVTIEYSLLLAFTAAYLYFIGWNNVIALFIIPIAVQNYCIMSYISTNHNLSPITRRNDPLANSLTVTTNPIQDALHLNFGYHVEHHLFPTMSGAHMKQVHVQLKKAFPEDFKVMKKTAALKRLYKTPRIYKNAKTLIHPETLETSPTL